jgi:hypothetical protein
MWIQELWCKRGSFYEEIGSVVDNVPRYDMKILFGDFNEKVGREENFQTDNW